MTLAALLLGPIAWSLTEYVLHRFDGHTMKGRTPFSRQHLRHHADPDWFAPWWQKLLLAVLIVGPTLLLTRWALGLAFAAPFTASFIGSWLAYEWLHRRLHTHPPTTAWGRWARLHHLQHHHGSPRHNHGVTSPLWDIAFGTFDPRPVVTVPRKQAPAWLVDPQTGEVREPYADAYQVKGRARPAPPPQPTAGQPVPA